MSGAQGGWRRLRVAARVAETADIVSLHLEAADGAPLAPFSAGQFLTLRLIGPDGRPVPRNYSLSSDPADLSRYRISVRRHAAGLGSARMHDGAPVGTELEAAAPKGRFALDESARRPVLLLAAGIGLTPLAAMAHRLAALGRETHLLHAVRDAADRPFAAEMAALAARHPSLAWHPVDTRAHGRIDAAMLRRLVPMGDYEAYLCGPSAFMQAMLDILVALGVREERIAHEFFGPGRPLVAGGTTTIAPEPPVAPVSPAATVSTELPTVRFARAGLAVQWDGESRTLLDFAESHGLTPAFSCRNGICNTCLAAVEGRVRYIEEPLEAPAAGEALLCCAVPDGPVSIDI
jgi:ferredoxin-NADP reductase